jgi:UDP-GlcNAc:undecaprenyl-phosphate/decaprenyl-phosphate GlcNAc-1-phosphate transferase
LQTSDLIPLTVSLLTSIVITPLVRRIAIRAGMVAQPKTDRWHQKPTALLGGVAIALSVAIAWFLFAEQLPGSRQAWMILFGSFFLGLVGFVDDIIHMKPYQKLICQVMASALVISAGLTLPWTDSEGINVAITFFWLVGITNAINLLDNMDGLAAGVSATAAIFLAINLALNGQTPEAMMLGVLAAALIGFLFYNSNPASVFMGDTGSMFIGFFLASAALMSATGARSRSFMVVLAVPVLVLLIPIFDTTLVTVLRKIAGRPASQGGRDHTSHRLVALGMSESRAVWLLYGLAAASGLLAIAVNHLDWTESLAVVIGFVVALSLLGIYLGGVRVYDDATEAAARQRPVIAFIVDLSYKRRVFEVLLDLVLIMLAFYGASQLLSGPVSGPVNWTLLTFVPVLVFAQLFSMLAAGSYRGIWRYVSIDNLIVYGKGIVIGTALGYAGMRFVVGMESLKPAVFVLDAVLLFIFVAGSRVAFKLFRHFFRVPSSATTRRAMIFGAGDGGEIMLRELQNNRAFGLTPIGFIDDDSLKAGRNIHGLPVHLATPHGIPAICEANGVDELVVATSKLTPARLEQIARTCAEAGVRCHRMSIQLDPVIPAARDENDAEARRDQLTIDSPAAAAGGTKFGEIKKRRDSQPIMASDINKRRDSKPFRAFKP